MKVYRWRGLLAGFLMMTMLAGLLPAPTLTVVLAQATPKPQSVTVAGTIQSKLGCAADWKPECASTYLTYNPTYDLWTGEFNLAAGEYEYKAALNNSWDENYGAKANPGGSNISLTHKGGPIKFYYDHKTHWITESSSSIIATVVGDFQTKLGCAKDNQPDCLKSWLQSPKADGIYSLTVSSLPAGDYQAKVAVNEKLDETYGEKGAPNGPNIKFNVPFVGAAITFRFEASSKTLTIGEAQQGDLSVSQAHWINKDTIAWKVDATPDNKYQLHYDPAGKLKLEINGVTGGSILPLTLDPNGLSKETQTKFPYLNGFVALKLAPADVAKVPEILQGQIAVSALRNTGRLLNASSLQIPGVLDDLFYYKGTLGVTFQGNTPSLRLWAPTAKTVKMYMFDDPTTRTRAATADLTRDGSTGTWAVTGTPDWKDKYFIYDVEVFSPYSGKLEHNLVTDPYSVSLSANSTRTQIVNLSDPALQPTGWNDVKKPTLNSFSDSVIYELHIRDFSISDQTVPEEKRGTYLAFSEANSNGMKHLKALAAAGLTHIHLLPAFDFATVNEIKKERKEPDLTDVLNEPGNSDKQQTATAKAGDTDGFNWGYDPLHYTVPEGSYATNPDGGARIKEFREMVKSLNDNGLRVVMDVVYNHTSASGQDFKAILDRIVPGYYHRLNPEGKVENSTCCANTASENAMMEKLLIDSVTTWAKEYKIDGFRFDLMGHHLVSNMLKLQDTIRALTPAKDGVDGTKIYLYGEGWDFGEVAKNARGVNATQINLAGTGIGTFNDRLRDAVRGGGPFSPLAEQGFVSGLYYEPNGTFKGTKDDEKAKLLRYQDWIKVGLAGNLKDYTLVDSTGKTVTGAQVDYNGAPAGYTLSPQENIVYVEAHDNETLYDALAFKLADGTKIQDRVRMQNQGMDIVLLSQGIPFLHAGQDMLRSKSLDRDSYNSGDYFNKLDFSYQSNNFGVGLPVQSKNGTNWPLMKTLLGKAELKPAKNDIMQAVDHTREMLQIRKSSKLFRLDSGDEVKARLKFLDSPIPGTIVMTLSDLESNKLDPQNRRFVVVFNSSNQTQAITAPALVGSTLALHPVQANSADPLVKTASFDSASGTLNIPAHTTAVFAESWSSPIGSGASSPSTLPATGTGIFAAENWLWALALGLLLVAGLAYGARRWLGNRKSNI